MLLSFFFRDFVVPIKAIWPGYFESMELNMGSMEEPRMYPVGTGEDEKTNDHFERRSMRQGE